MSLIESNSTKLLLPQNGVYQGRAVRPDVKYITIQITATFEGGNSGLLEIYYSIDGIFYDTFGDSWTYTTLTNEAHIFKETQMKGAFFYVKWTNNGSTAYTSFNLNTKLAETTSTVSVNGVIDIPEVDVNIEGQTVFSKIRDTAGNALNSTNGRLNVDISGQRVVSDISGQRVVTDISGQRVVADISGQRVDISGQRVDISGQTLNVSGSVSINNNSLVVDTIDNSINEAPYDLILNGPTLWADSLPAGNPFFSDPNGREGWYYDNLSNASNRSNIYWYGNPTTGNLQENDMTFSQLSGMYCIVTNDYVENASLTIPTMGIFSQPTGSNDFIPGFAHSRWVYQLNALNRSKLRKGETLLLYTGSTRPNVHINIPSYELSLVSTNGDASSSEIIAYMSINTQATTSKIGYLLQYAGYLNSAIGFNREYSFKNSKERLGEDNLSKLKFTGDNLNVNIASGSLTVDISGQVVTDISGQRVDISGQRVLVDISGQRVVTDISGQRVVTDISGQRVVTDISGQRIDISGQRVLVDISGQRVVTDISGQRVDISGQRVVTDISGQTVVTDISGQRVDISGQRVDISGQRILVDISGQRMIVDISGQRVDISGQKVVVDISGQRINISGQGVDISGQWVNVSNMISNYALENGNLASIKTNTDKNNYDASGNLKINIASGSISVSSVNIKDTSGNNIYADLSGNLKTNIQNSFLDVHNKVYHSGNWIDLVGASNGHLIVNSSTQDGNGVDITSSTVNSKNGLDVFIINDTVKVDISGTVATTDISGYELLNTINQGVGYAYIEAVAVNNATIAGNGTATFFNWTRGQYRRTVFNYVDGNTANTDSISILSKDSLGNGIMIATFFPYVVASIRQFSGILELSPFNTISVRNNSSSSISAATLKIFSA
jgi:hypothetical protein